jgi:Rrf2 family protein
MTFKKSTRYALYAAMEMARSGGEDQVTVTRVAQRYSISTAVLAKIFQQLVRAGIAESTRGVRGGYRLARKASELTVLEVIEAFELARSARQCLLAEEGEKICNDYTLCRLRKLFDEVEETARCTYASVTLETLVGNRPRQSVELRVLK